MMKHINYKTISFNIADSDISEQNWQTVPPGDARILITPLLTAHNAMHMIYRYGTTSIYEQIIKENAKWVPMTK